MPTVLGDKFANTWRGKPLQMQETDYPIWLRFLDQYGDLFHTFYYNVMVGEFAIELPEDASFEEKIQRASLSKKIDAIAVSDTDVWIIEVATSPGLRAIGQLMTYRSLWFEDPKFILNEHFVLVAEAIDRDLISAASQNGIEVIIMP